MSNDDNNNTPLTLKKIGLFLKENGVSVQPLQESANVVETFLIETKQLIKTCELLKNNKDMKFDLLVSISGVDKPDENSIESVYHLFSTEYHHKVVVKAKAPRDNPVVPSVTNLWITADWHERETFDLLGIKYDNHPNMKRLLMPDDWIGYPLRKDYIENDERLIWNKR
ncbi:MAG: NADH-quinone oxidoreductase subunit C [Cyanobacteriota bacterium]